MSASSNTSPTRGGRIKTGLSIFGVVAALGVYNYAFPNGPLNAVLGIKPSAGTEACTGLLKTPLCYVWGWTATSEETPFSIEYRKARVRMMAAEHGVSGDVRLASGPHLSEAEDLAGYHEWLGHASEDDFEQALADMDAALALQAVIDLQTAGEAPHDD